MQITHVEVIPVDLHLRVPYRTRYQDEAELEQITVIFVHLETQQGQTAWGCAAFDPALTGETGETVLRACQACALRTRDLNPLNLEYALTELEQLCEGAPSALCAFDVAFHDLLGLAAGLPLHRLLGGYRDRIQTSVTINLCEVPETVERARDRARQGFRILKLKGGRAPAEDIERVRAVHRALPHFTLRLDADQGYTVAEALEVARALAGQLEMLEEPVPTALGLTELAEITRHSPVPILADQSACGAAAVLKIATQHAANGVSVKLSTCGGFRRARQLEAIARAGQLITMVSCLNEPALLTAAGLAFALSSPGVRYGDLDGHFDLADDPSQPRFILEDGWFIAPETPGLGCTVDL